MPPQLLKPVLNQSPQHSSLTASPLTHSTHSIPHMLHAQVAGADGRIDREEFVRLFKTLLAKIKGDPEPVAEAAAAAGYAAE